MLARLFRAGSSVADVPDGTLLRDALTDRAPAAFEALVSRHGPTVWAVCRRLLRDHADAEDAFQATFLVLLRSRPEVGEVSAVGGWLYRVAYRTALKVRTATARRTRREAANARPEGIPPVEPPDDTLTTVHEELAALPDIYRLAVLLCDVEGLPRRDAAARLGWKEGSLSGRLNRGRKLLADCLRARGVVPVALAVGATVLPPSVFAATVELGLSELSLEGVTRAVPPSVAALTRGVLNDMATKYAMKMLAALVLAVGTLAALGGGLTDGPKPSAAIAAPLPHAQTADPGKLTVEHVFLASHQKIQKELKLSAEARVAMIDALAEIDDQEEEYRRRQQASLVAVRQEKDYVAARRAAVAKSLTPAEFRRLIQIDWQLCGAMAFRDPEVASALALSDKQKKLVAEAVEGMFKVLQGKGAGRQAVIPYWNEEEFPEMWETTRDAAVAQLNVAQRKKWDELIGAKLSFDPVRHLRTFGSILNRVGEPTPEPPPVQVLIPEPPAPPLLPPPLPQAPPAQPTSGPGTQPLLPPTAPPVSLPPVGR